MSKKEIFSTSGVFSLAARFASYHKRDKWVRLDIFSPLLHRVYFHTTWLMSSDRIVPTHRVCCCQCFLGSYDTGGPLTLFSTAH